MLKVAVVDGMGGGIGSQLVVQLRQDFGQELDIVALGTNSTATAAMVKAGANRGATGENAIRVCLLHVNCLLGPIGIVIPDALMGEITSAIAQTIVSSPCRKILLPVNQPHIELVGLENRPLNQIIREASGRIRDLYRQNG